MDKEKDAFYVVRKGDIVGVYKSLTDCQAQVGTSVCDPSVSVFKGYSLPKETEEYLSSRGLQNALYTVNAMDVHESLLGELVPCPFQQPPSNEGKREKVSPSKRSLEVLESSSNLKQTSSGNVLDGAVGNSLKHIKVSTGNERSSTVGRSQHRQMKREWTAIPDSPEHLMLPILGYCNQKKESLMHSSLDNKYQSSKTERPPQQRTCADISVDQASCILEFDGASKGNPGLAGAGAVLRAEDGRVLCRLREGVGIATCNVAEYRAALLGLKHALNMGFKRISVQGDSKLVCMQVQGLWKTKNDNMATLCKEAKELKNKFDSFQIRHVMREFNTEADTQSNKAVNLQNGQVEVDWEK